MSTDGALKLAPADAPADAPAGLAWIGRDVAMERLGISVGQFNRRCLQEWQPAGKARKARSAATGQHVWEVHESADPRLAPVKFADQLTREFDTSALLDDGQDKVVKERKRLLDEWERELALERELAGRRRQRFNEADVTQAFVDRQRDAGAAVSRSNLFRWRKLFNRHGIKGLLDGRWNTPAAGPAATADGQPARQDEDPFFACVKRHYLNGRLTLTDCMKVAIALAAENGWALPALTDAAIYKACQRFVAALPPQLVTLKREGGKAFADRCEPAITRDYTTIDTNDCWIADHHTFDVMVAHEGRHVRPTVTAFMDARSRKIVGFVVSPHAGNTDTILEALDVAIAAHFKPRTVMVDNGDDFLSKALQGQTKAERRAARKAARDARTPGGTAAPGWGARDADRETGALTRLEIETRRVWKYHGQSKAIERQFGTVCLQFAKHFDTYTGRNTLEKPEDLKRQVAAGKAPTLAEFTAAYADYLENVYHRSPHRGDGMDGRSPADVFDACLKNPVSVDADRRRFALLPRVGPLRVGKQGVRWKGLSFGGFDAQMQRLYRQKVWVAVDPRDLSGVLVLDAPNGKLLFRAAANVKLPFFANGDDLKAAIAEKKQLRRTLRQYVEKRPRMSEDTHQLLARATRRRHKAEANPAADPDTPVTPPPAEPFRPAGDANDSSALRRAFQPPLKLAVGAESDALPQPGRFVYGGGGGSSSSSSSDQDPTPAGTPFIYRPRASSASEDESS